MATLKTKKRVPAAGVDLHKWIATGGKPKDFVGSKGINSSTVNKIKK